MSDAQDHVQASTVSRLISKTSSELACSSEDDALRTCPEALINQLSERPDLVLTRALQEIRDHASSDLPMRWLRLYEDASLHKVLHVFDGVHRDAHDSLDWIADVVEAIDMAVLETGAPARMPIFQEILTELEELTTFYPINKSINFSISEPPRSNTIYPVERMSGELSLEAFQTHLDGYGGPIVVRGCLEGWPATERWQNPGYLLNRTLGGRRLIPVEFGDDYKAANYKSGVTSFSRYLEDFVLPERPSQMAYLAQHDLFMQIPSLRRDIAIPDCCYTEPPPSLPDSAAAATPGLDQVTALSEPLLNAWIGPKGSKTPLHTDPYHNILCQVVGYKYVRLYAPEQRHHLSAGAAGGLVDRHADKMPMNTSCEPSPGQSTHQNFDMQAAVDENCTVKTPTDSSQAEYLEAVLAPGESLYVPLGWWHYVESLSISASVSFWWN